jgi:hypothetical protein
VEFSAVARGDHDFELVELIGVIVDGELGLRGRVVRSEREEYCSDRCGCYE